MAAILFERYVAIKLSSQEERLVSEPIFIRIGT